MKKLIFAILALAMPFASSLTLKADDDDDGPQERVAKRMTTAERKEAMKALVETRPNGDVVIKRNPAVDNGLKSKAPRVPGYLMDLMLHIDPNMDFEKFNKSMVKFVGESGSRTGSGVLNACDEYLGTINMRLKLVKFQPNNVRNRIDGGLPYFMIMSASNAYEAIAERSKKRPETNDWKEWAKTQRKETVKSRGKVEFITWALLRGYNKQSGEYLVQVNGKDIWMLDSEIKLLMSSMYEPRI